MSSCGYLPCQFVTLETLLRWLVPRNQPELRATSAAYWFPEGMYSRQAVDIFLERPWMNFFQDARDFLNAHNSTNDLIVSVICQRFCIGEIMLISGTEKQQSWLDINSTGRCLSVLLDPQLLGRFGPIDHKSCETVLITNDAAQTVVLKRDSSKPTISIQMLSPPQVHPSMISVGTSAPTHVELAVSARTDTRKLDHALRSVLADKYQLLLDLEHDPHPSPQSSVQNSKKMGSSSEGDTRFSHPAEVRRKKRSGYVVRSNKPHSWKSPSTASTSSLAQLHDKLAALPLYKYDRDPVSVCAHPELSIVTEVSETDDRQSLNTASTLKFKPYGVCTRDNNNFDGIRKSQSDGELKTRSKDRRLSPAIHEGHSTSCLLVATVGSADDSVINDTIERLSKSKDFNADKIVDLLVKEALHSNEIDSVNDSGINTDDKRNADANQESSDAIDNTPFADAVREYQKINVNKKKGRVVISKSSTTDESNTDAISETNFVNSRRRTTKPTEEHSRVDEVKTFDVEEVEEFFNQHFAQNAAGDVMISPTLAKKINESSSDSNDSFENYIVMNEINDNDNLNINDNDVIECLNSMVDKVCSDFDKCTEYLTQSQMMLRFSDKGNDSQQHKDKDGKDKTSKKASKKGIKLKYKINTKTEKKVRQKNASKKTTSTIEDAVEDIDELKDKSNLLNNEKSKDFDRFPKIISRADFDLNDAQKDNLSNDNHISPIPNEEAKRNSTPLQRRKRKLYSPKDETVERVRTPAILSDTEEDVTLSELKNTKKRPPKYTATSYKDIEKERKKQIRKPRNRRSKCTVETPSPRTLKLSRMFDKLKETVESNERIQLADRTSKRIEVYNFTSDSDDDFVMNKRTISKRNSATTVGSVESATTVRGKRPKKRINYNENKIGTGKREPKPKNVKPNKQSNKPTRMPLDRDLIDERMREAAPEELNTSLVIEQPQKEYSVPELVLKEPPKIEAIDEGNAKNEISKKRSKKKDLSSKTKLATGKLNTLEVLSVGNRTESPLPNLVVESVPLKDEGNDSVSAKMLLKFKRIHEGQESRANDTTTTLNMLSDLEKNNTRETHENVIDFENNLAHINEYFSGETDSDRSDISRKHGHLDQEKLCTAVVEDDNDIGMDISIATDGITGHGDEDEAPPSDKTHLQTRCLEIEDLDKTLKEYFEQLDKKINDIDDNSDNGNVINKSEIKNPIVRMTRLSSEDISKVSRKSIESTCLSSKEKSPVVSICRIPSLEINKWLPSQSSKSKQNYLNDFTKQKSFKETKLYTNDEQSKDLCKSLYDAHKWFPSRRESSTENSEKTEPNQNKVFIRELRLRSREISVVSSTDERKRKKTNRATDKDLKEHTNDARPDDVSEVTNARRSMISPIKLGDFKSDANQRDRSQVDDCVKRIKDIFSQGKIVKSKLRALNTVSKDDLAPDESVSDGRALSDCRKRKYEENENEVKRLRLDTVYVESSPSRSSVNEWFRRNEISSREETVNLSVLDTVQNVLEKLDTTLVDANNNTSRKLVNLFVEAQKELSKQKEERRKMYKETASDILNAVVRLVDDKFADLDRRSQEMETNFMERLKKQASEVIVNDCKQKRAMVQLLKEDFSSVVDHLNRNKI
nr:uncharacterized protein PFB0145c-like isoform X2 [Bombyx mori]